MTVYTDQAGREVCVHCTPQRIVSLVPSLTELLYHLGLEEQVTGITKFCVHPANWFRSKTRVGGTKNIHIDTLRSLSPDLVIAGKEENIKEQVEAVAAFAPVWVSDIRNLDDALDAICSIGTLTGRATKAKEIAAAITERFAALQPVQPPVKTAYLIWKDPYMTVGGDTFIHDMLTRCGFSNIYAAQARYPVIGSLHELEQLGCELVLLSSEPYPFKETQVTALQQQLPATRVQLVNGEYFSWYGSRLLEAPAYFHQLLHGSAR